MGCGGLYVEGQSHIVAKQCAGADVIFRSAQRDICMISQDIRHGVFVFTAISMVLWVIIMIIGVFAQAQNPVRENIVDDEWVCPQAVAHGFYYTNKPDLDIQQDAIWSIIADASTDDSQTYVWLRVYHTIQRVAQNIRRNPDFVVGRNMEKFWLNTLNRVNAECEFLLNEQRFPSE